jgi:solute carrier family 50 protein (sugar transporter)
MSLLLAPMHNCTSSQTFEVQVFGWCGCAAALFLFVAPIPTMLHIVKTKSTGDFSPLPYLVSMLQCGLWSVYALPPVTPCKLQPLVTNGLGFFLEMSYVYVFIVYSKARGQMILKLALTLGVLAALATSALLLAPKLNIPSWPDKDASRTTTLLGMECVVLNVMMYAAPLGVVRTVIRLRSVRPMPLLLTLGCGACSSLWTAYAFLTKDDFILVPNIAGLALFVLQLAVYRRYSPFCKTDGMSTTTDGDDSLLGKPREALLGGDELGSRQNRLNLISPIADGAPRTR